MLRRAFTMRLKPDALPEYKRHHDEIWPDLVAEIERSGIGQITTFQRGLDLFLFSQIADEAAWNRLWTSEVHRRWAEVMEPLMHLRDDGIVDAGELTEIFHLTTPAGAPQAKSAARKKTGKQAKSKAKPAAKRTAKHAKKVGKQAMHRTAAKKAAAKPKAAKKKAGGNRR